MRRPDTSGAAGRRPAARALAATLAVTLATGLAAALGGCNDTRDLAPPDPASPWQTSSVVGAKGKDGPHTGAHPGLYDLPRDPALPAFDPAPTIDPTRDYDLPELVDIAERNNKDTRVAWEQARQAAIAVGISRAAFLPALTLSALGGYRRETTPVPDFIDQNGYITSQAEAVFPTLTISYLLVDFGARAAAEHQAEQASFAANVEFTGVHQALILTVARAYYALEAAEAAEAAARKALDNANLLQVDARDRLAHGVGTVTDVDEAATGVAQGQFDIASTGASTVTARATLLQALGAPPDTALRVSSIDDRPVPRGAAGTVRQLMDDALRQRPDLLADVARLRRSEAGIALARSGLFPVVSLNAKGSGDIGRLSSDEGEDRSFVAPEAGVYLDFTWTLYSGGERANRVRLAESQRAEAADTLEAAEDNAMREVAVADDELTAAIQQYDAAVALRTASQTSFASSADAFRHGVGTLVAADTARTNLDRAIATVARTHAQVLTDAAALALATGQLTSSAALPP